MTTHGLTVELERIVDARLAADDLRIGDREAAIVAELERREQGELPALTDLERRLEEIAKELGRPGRGS